MAFHFCFPLLKKAETGQHVGTIPGPANCTLLDFHGPTQFKHFGLARFGRHCDRQFVTLTLWAEHFSDSKGRRLDSKKWLSNSRVTFGLFYTCYLTGWLSHGCVFEDLLGVLIVQLITRKPCLCFSASTAQHTLTPATTLPPMTSQAYFQNHSPCRFTTACISFGRGLY